MLLKALQLSESDEDPIDVAQKVRKPVSEASPSRAKFWGNLMSLDT